MEQRGSQNRCNLGGNSLSKLRHKKWLYTEKHMEATPGIFAETVAETQKKDTQ